MKKRRTLYDFAPAVAGVFFAFCGVFPQKAGAEGEHPKDKLSAYTTYFSENDEGRCANIALAAARIDGIALQPYGELSFNSSVGARTAENGYKTAKIILKGEFVEGLGGGVCQVSTTLYNAALLAGLTATEYHAHSLRVNYVPPSRDAMVSSQSDLKIFNPHAETVYLSAAVSSGAIKITVYGKDEGLTYSIESKTLEVLPPPNPSVEIGDKDAVVRYGKEGAKSEAYLRVYKNGVLLSVKRLRSDIYAPLRGMITKKS